MKELGRRVYKINFRNCGMRVPSFLEMLWDIRAKYESQSFGITASAEKKIF